MYCKYCGADIPGDSGFCEKCGKKLAKEGPVKEKVKKPAKKINKLAIILATTIPAALIIITVSILASLGFFSGTQPVETVEAQEEFVAIQWEEFESMEDSSQQPKTEDEIRKDLEKAINKAKGVQDEDVAEETAEDTASAENTEGTAEETEEKEAIEEEKEDNSKAALHNQLDSISEEYKQAWNHYKATYEEGPGWGGAKYDDPQWIAFDETYLAKQKELLGKLQSLNWLNYTEEKGTYPYCNDESCGLKPYLDDNNCGCREAQLVTPEKCEQYKKIMNL